MTTYATLRTGAVPHGAVSYTACMPWPQPSSVARDGCVQARLFFTTDERGRRLAPCEVARHPATELSEPLERPVVLTPARPRRSGASSADSSPGPLLATIIHRGSVVGAGLVGLPSDAIDAAGQAFDVGGVRFERAGPSGEPLLQGGDAADETDVPSEAQDTETSRVTTGAVRAEAKESKLVAETGPESEESAEAWKRRWESPGVPLRIGAGRCFVSSVEVELSGFVQSVDAHTEYVVRTTVSVREVDPPTAAEHDAPPRALSAGEPARPPRTESVEARRRVTSFRELHDELDAADGPVPPPFPLRLPLRPRWTQSNAFKQERLLKLQGWLQDVLQTAAAHEGGLASAPPPLERFLALPLPSAR